MRMAVPVLILALGSGFARAEDVVTVTTSGAGAAPAGMMVSSSISLSLPLTGLDRAARQAEEDGYRRDLYARSVGECELLLDSIAKSCVVTSINVSTQINASPGQPEYLYVASNITMQVELK